jgi:hypothetical protein
MPALSTVADYLAQARVLVQDTVVPYRYPDADFIFALNAAVLEARRLRPDIFLTLLDSTVPAYTVPGDAVSIDVQYQLPFLFYMAGYVGIRDAEATQEARAVEFMSLFKAKLVAP